MILFDVSKSKQFKLMYKNWPAFFLNCTYIVTFAYYFTKITPIFLEIYLEPITL